MTSPAAVAQAMYQLPPSAFDTPSLVNPGSPPGPPGGDEDGLQGDLPRRGSLTLMQSLKELEEAKPGYALADEMYDGEIGDLPMSQAIIRLVQKSGVNDIEDLNYAKVPVDAVVDKLGIRAVIVSAGDDAETDDEDTEPEQDETDSDTPAKATESSKKKIAEKAQEQLDDLRKTNQMAAEEPQLFRRASRYGDGYLFVWPVVQAEEDSELDRDGDGFMPMDAAQPGKIVGVDIYVNSPLTVRAFYDEEQPLRLTHVIKSWEWIDPDDPEADKPRCRATLYFPDRIERWVTKPGEQAKDREAWVPFLESEEDQWPLPLPPGVDRIPFFHFRNDRPYGKPEHKAAYGPQRLINKLIAAHGTTIDFQIFPQRYALLDPKADNGLLNLIDPDHPEDDGDDPEGEGHSQLRADPSAVWKLTATAVGQFAPADPNTFIAPLDRYIKAISELCGIPLDRFTGYSTPPSGESRRVGNEVLYDKVGDRRELYATVLGDAYEFALGLLGFKDLTVDVKWKPLDSASGIDDWNIVNTKISAGVPVKTALVEAGYPDDEVDSWLVDQGGADLVRRVALLNSIGTAVQALAAGVAVGMVSSEQVADIVSRVMGQVGEQLPDLDVPVEVHPQQAQQQMELQNSMRGQQMAEHIAQHGPAGGPPGRQDGGDQKDGGAPPQQNSRPALPAMPAPPPPVKVGGSKS